MRKLMHSITYVWLISVVLNFFFFLHHVLGDPMGASKRGGVGPPKSQGQAQRCNLTSNKILRKTTINIGLRTSKRKISTFYWHKEKKIIFMIEVYNIMLLHHVKLSVIVNFLTKLTKHRIKLLINFIVKVHSIICNILWDLDPPYH